MITVENGKLLGVCNEKFLSRPLDPSFINRNRISSKRATNPDTAETAR